MEGTEGPDVGARWISACVAVVAVLGGLVLGPIRFVGPAAATPVCGHISTDETWTAAGNPYLLTCDVTVDPGVTLTVGPGVDVRADGPALIVEGLLAVAGSASAPVTFASNRTVPSAGDWYGILLGAGGSVALSNVSVRHAFLGLTWASWTGASATTAVLRDAEFAENFHGIDFAIGYVGPALDLARGNIHDNYRGLNSTGPLVVADTSIVRNEVGVHFWAYAPGITAELRNVTVADNRQVGIRMQLDLNATAPVATVTCSEVVRNGIGFDIVDWWKVGLAYRNNFVGNGLQARDDYASSRWDNGTAGNYWSDYAGTDADGDGFGDTPYVIDADSRDNHPYVAPVSCGSPVPADRPPGPATPTGAALAGPGLAEVALSWNASPDDGGGEDDVVAYDLYASASYDGAGTGYGLLATLPAGSTGYTDAGGGVGDAAPRFYRLVARDAAGHETASEAQFAKYARRLPAGPHLASIPVSPSDPSARVVFQTLDYEVVRAYVNPAGQGRNWRVLHRDKPWSDLATIEDGRAFWVLVRADSDLVVAGLVPPSVTIRLETGWNLVGYPSFTDRTVSDALAGAEVQTVEGFDGASPPYYLRRLAPTDPLHAGDGIWVHVSQPFDWTLPS